MLVRDTVIGGEERRAIDLFLKNASAGPGEHLVLPVCDKINVFGNEQSSIGHDGAGK